MRVVPLGWACYSRGEREGDVLTYSMTDGRSTTDVEQFLRWVAGYANLTPEFMKQMRDRDKADRGVDRVIDEAAAKFEDRT